MPRDILVSEPFATRRRLYGQIVEGDGISPALGRGGQQPQISVNGAAWSDDYVGLLVEIGNGRYYAELAVAALQTVGDIIESRFQGSGTAECPLDTVRVVSYDPHATARIVANSPVQPGGTVNLIRGDDYYADDNRALLWDGDGEDAWPDLTGATVTLYLADLAVVGSVVAATGQQRVRAELDADDTADLIIGRRRYEVIATLAGGHTVTLVQGTAVIAD